MSFVQTAQEVIRANDNSLELTGLVHRAHGQSCLTSRFALLHYLQGAPRVWVTDLEGICSARALSDSTRPSQRITSLVRASLSALSSL